MGKKDDSQDAHDQHEDEHADEIDFGQFEDSMFFCVGHGRHQNLKRR